MVDSDLAQSLAYKQMSEKHAFHIEEFQIVANIVFRVFHGDRIIGPLRPIVGQ